MYKNIIIVCALHLKHKVLASYTCACAISVQKYGLYNMRHLHVLMQTTNLSTSSLSTYFQ